MGCRASTAIALSEEECGQRPMPPHAATPAAFSPQQTSHSPTLLSVDDYHHHAVARTGSESEWHRSPLAAFVAMPGSREATLMAKHSTLGHARRSDSRIRQEWHELRQSVQNDMEVRLAQHATGNTAHASAAMDKPVRSRSPRFSGEGSQSSSGTVAAGGKTNALHVPVPAGEHRARGASVFSVVTFLSSGAVGLSDFYNAYHGGVINAFIRDPEYMLIVDARSASDYAVGHICSAVHHEAAAATGGDIDVGSYNFVIIYDDCGLPTGEGAALRDELCAKGWDTVGLLSGGLERLVARYPFMVTTCVERNLEAILQFPSEIRPGQLYIGNCEHASSREVVEQLGLTHIVNVTKEHPNAFPDSIRYFHVALSDEPGQDILRHFKAISDFIEEAIVTGKVMVHFTLGVSRSSASVAAFLMRYKRWTVRQTLDFISDKRQGIKPNRGFLKQLGQWEVSIFGEAKTDIDDIF